MWYLIFILCFISNVLVLSEAKEISVSLDGKKSGECEVSSLYNFKVGETAEVKFYQKNKLVKVDNLSIERTSSSNNPIKSNSTDTVTIPIKCIQDGGNWTINFNKSDWYTCRVKVNIVTEDVILKTFVITTPILIIIIIGQTCGLVYLICKVKKGQEPGREKCIDNRPDTPQSEVRYISGPVLRNNKIIPVNETNRDSEIYDFPDITIGDQGTLKSNLSIAQRPPMKLPEEDVYLEPGEVLNDLPPAFEMSGRPRPNKNQDVLEKQMKPLPTPMEPTKPKITPAMLNRFQNNQPSPIMSRKPEPKSTLGRSRDPLPDPPGPARHNELNSTLGRNRGPLPEPPGAVRNNEIQSTLGRSRDPLPDHPGPVRNFDLQSSLGRSRDPLPEPPGPARNFDLQSSLGRSRDPLPEPPGPARNFELQSSLGRRDPLPDPPGPVRNFDLQSSLGRSRDPLPDPPGPVRKNEPTTFPRNREPISSPFRNNVVPVPPAQYPIPGPSNLKKPLKSAAPMPVIPIPGPEILKKTLKPVPPPKPQPPKEHHAPFSNRPIPPTSVEGPSLQRTPSSIEEQVKFFNEQRELEQFPTPADDDEWETYEPLDQRNLYSV